MDEFSVFSPGLSGTRTSHTLSGNMPGGGTALDGAKEVKELGFSPLTVLPLTETCREH